MRFIVSKNGKIEESKLTTERKRTKGANGGRHGKKENGDGWQNLLFNSNLFQKVVA